MSYAHTNRGPFSQVIYLDVTKTTTCESTLTPDCEPAPLTCSNLHQTSTYSPGSETPMYTSSIEHTVSENTTYKNNCDATVAPTKLWVKESANKDGGDKEEGQQQNKERPRLKQPYAVIVELNNGKVVDL